MESLGNLARVEGFKANIAINGKVVTLLESAEAMTCIIESASPFEPSMLLGSDLRESDRVHTLRDWVPPALMAKDAKSQVKASVDGTHVNITNRQDNPNSPFVTFEIAKVL